MASTRTKERKTPLTEAEKQQRVEEFLKTAKRLIIQQYSTLPKDQHPDILTEDEIFIVNLVKTFESWNASFLTVFDDGLRFEVKLKLGTKKAVVDIFRSISSREVDV